MFKLTAKLRDNAALEMERWGCAHYSLYTDETSYPYNLGNLKFTKASNDWTVYCFSREDIGLHRTETTTFPDRASALRWVRETYEAAQQRYADACAEVLALLHQNLSPVKYIGYLKDGAATPEQDRIVIEVISTHKKCEDRFTFQMAVTVQEALTALDYLYERSDKRFVINVIGRVGEKGYVYHRNGYTKWIVPAYGTDYQIGQWASQTGEGRRQTNAFRAAINEAGTKRAAA